jgi:two-component system response regulator AtoC
LRRILIVDDEENIRLVLRTLLRRHGYEVEAAASGEEALPLVDSFGPDVVLADVRMPKMGGLDLLATLRAKGHDATVIVMSAYGNIDQAIDAMKAGAYDYIQKPFKNDEVVLALKKAEERETLRRENRALREEIRKESRYEDILAKSQKMQDIFRTITKIADYKTTVLVTGESGVGKELVARAIHRRSSRRGGPFVAVNCGAIPENLLESELFGHKKGAFTDAINDRHGLFEDASTGTLFLDEIGELPLGLQVKLLRVLEDELIRRLGETRDVKVDVRIIAATHRDLHAETKAGRFREDLFYRLNVLPIHIPPLRDRREDIPLLIEHFVARNNTRLRSNIVGIESEARRLLFEYAWPGNVRELENTVARLLALAPDERLTLSLWRSLAEPRPAINGGRSPSGDPGPGFPLRARVETFEREIIAEQFAASNNNQSETARRLGVSRPALVEKLHKYQLIS